MVLTKRAEAYPWGLADCLARACAQDAGWTDSRRRLDVAACARCSRRIGEAAHPGPSRKRALSRAPFPDRAIVEPATELLAAKGLDRWYHWLAEVVGCTSTTDALCAVPRLLDLLLAAFTRHLYYEEAPVYVIKHVVTALQRQHLHIKRQLPNAWQAISLWEALEPPKHRPPVPERLA